MRNVAWLLAVALDAAAASPSPQMAPGIVAHAEAVPQEHAAPAAMEGPAASALSIAGYAIQPPGQFHGGETVARNGEHWLALRMDPMDAALVPATVRVAAVEDPLVDAPGQRSGEAVSSAPGDEDIRMYLRGPAFVAGALEEATLDMPAGDGRRRIDLALSFRDARYRLWSECTPRAAAPVEGQRLFACRIVLRDAGREQVLARMDGYANAPGEPAWLGDDAAPSLLFAGDLDRDGELDLLFDVTDHYNVARPTLFLSSQAGPGELLRAVARHEATGC